MQPRGEPSQIGRHAGSHHEDGVRSSRVTRARPRQAGYASSLCYSPDMLIEVSERRIRLVRPRSFAGLMTLYESNHVRLARLLGDPARLPDVAVTHAARDLPLHLRVLERCRYTTTLHMTYFFPLERGGSVPDPDLVVKVYHDARLAEACSCAVQHHHRALTPYACRSADELEARWLMNVMFNKWLEFCLEKGHNITI